MGFKITEELGKGGVKFSGGGSAKPYSFDAQTIAQGEARRVESRRVRGENYSAIAQALKNMGRMDARIRVVGDPCEVTGVVVVAENSKFERLAKSSAKKERATERAWKKAIGE